MATKRRIRCLVCKKLVASSPPDDTSTEDESAYSVIPLRVANKSGCVCSSCIDHYSAKIETNIEAKAGKFDPSSKNTSESLEDYGFKENACQTTDTSKPQSSEIKVIPNETSTKTDEEKYFEDLMRRYKCLDYSLDILSQKVNKVVFGQSHAVNDVLYSLYFNQMSNLLEDIGQPHLKHKHILLIGGTGVGKTLLATTAAKTFGVVHSISNATPITSAGYIGDKVEHVLERLLDAANGDLVKAQNGVIILDEIDKKRAGADSNGKDVTGKAVQQELLKLLEPSKVWIKNNTISFYTGNLTIILMGAFVGLDEVIERRTKKHQLGFTFETPSKKAEIKEILPDDLIEYGFIPEMIGRIPIICQLNKLTHDILVNIIYAQLEYYDLMFKFQNVEFYFDPILVEKIADELLESKTGARDVETKIDTILRPALYRIFQSPSEGICEIDANGAIKILTYNSKNSKNIESIEFPPIQKYLDLAADYD